MAHDGTALVTQGLEVYLQSRRAGWEAKLASRLVEFIEATRESLDCAIYDLRHPDVLAALARVGRSGRRLRIAFDAGKDHTGGLRGDPTPGGTQEALQKAGLLGHATAVHAGGRHLMHNKFLVRDGGVVWTGSANFTHGGLELQDNNCLVVTSPEVAASYTAAFEALLTQHHERRPHLRPQALATSSATLTPYFEPVAGEGIEQVVNAALKRARRVRALTFLISDPGVLEALEALKNNPDADLRGVFDPHGMQDVLRYSRQDRELFWFMHDPRFVAAPSHAFEPDREQDFMHNKVLIVDDRLVITGSYNFSENAETNDENLVVIDSPAAAQAYTAYFDALFTAYGGVLPEHETAPAAPQPQVEVVREQTAREQKGRQVAAFERTLNPHVLRVPGHDGLGVEGLTFGRARTQFRGETEVGRTAHLVVFSDGSAEGNASAQAVLATGEADYAAVRDWFGGIDLPPGQQGDDQTVPRTATPIQVLMDSQAGGAYHFGCNATDLYIEPVPRVASGFMVAELVEVFEAAINNGWQCGQTNGEGLSRVLAGERSPGLIADLAQTMESWWSSGRRDYVNDNSATDQDENGNGCGTLFLYYLHSQLSYSWQQIVAAGGRTLGECYQKLTGKDPQTGFNDFVTRLATLDQGGQLTIPPSGNPFPIGQPSQPAVSTGSSATRVWLLVAVIVLVLVLAGVMVATGRIHLGVAGM